MNERDLSKKRTSNKRINAKVEPKKIKKKKIVKKGDISKSKNTSNVIRYEEVKSQYVPKNNRQYKDFKVTKTKKRSKHKKLFILISLIILLITIVLLLRYLPIFDAVDIVVEGTSKYKVEEITDILDIHIGQNVFSSFFRSEFIDSKTLPYVKDIKVALTLPNRIILKVEERIPKYFAFDKEHSRFFRIDEFGYILEESTIESKTPDEILTYAISFDNEVELGTKISDIYIDKLKIFTKISEEIEKSNINGKITKVSFENSLTTITLDDKLNIVFPNDTELKYKVAFLESILGKLSDDVVGIIDMTKENPTFSSF